MLVQKNGIYLSYPLCNKPLKDVSNGMRNYWVQKKPKGVLLESRADVNVTSAMMMGAKTALQTFTTCGGKVCCQKLEAALFSGNSMLVKAITEKE